MTVWVAGCVGLLLGAGVAVFAAWLPVNQGWRDQRDCGVAFFVFLRGARFADRRPSWAVILSAGVSLAGLVSVSWCLLPVVALWAPLALFCTVLLTLALGDLWDRWLPDVLTGPLTWAGLLWSPLAGPYARILGAVTGFGLLWFIAHVGRLRAKRETVGSGDIWMAGALGAWVGAEPVAWVVLAALIMMLPMKVFQRQDYGPLGVTLALSGGGAVFCLLLKGGS
jgi:leader peptidase (prepilin peptidase)/N-methyltransferase